MATCRVGERFFQEFNASPGYCLNAASGPSAGWHFQPGGGPEYCRACRDDDLPCARGEPGADGRLCPYREHALISRQEHEAWDVLLACQGQLRLAPNGQVIGIDIAAALTLATARGHELAVLSELLPAAEAGLVQALCIE